MAPWLLIALAAGCGQMYQAPGAPPPSEPQTEQQTPPTSSGDGRAAAEDPMVERMAEGAPLDPYAATATPAAARRKPPRAPSSEAEALVQAHNRVRAKHCAAPLTWSPRLAKVAQAWASSLRDKGCMFGHSGGTYGENLAAGTTGTLDAEAVVRMWYDEVSLYKFPNGGFSMKTGHFTQVVWRGTTQVGCGKTQCKNMDIWVCEYDPAGNWEGKYRENVLPTSCK